MRRRNWSERPLTDAEQGAWKLNTLKISEHRSGQHYNGQPDVCPLCPPDLDANTQFPSNSPQAKEEKP